MSYSIRVVGKDMEKLKEEIRKQQVKDPVNAPHSGVPIWVADHLCAEIDRVRVYQFAGTVFGLEIKANGSFHEQGSNDHFEVSCIQLLE